MWKARLLSGMAFLFMSGLVSGRELPQGETIEDETSDRRIASYEFEADGSGVLTIVVRADGDVSIMVTDENGQPLPNGQVDLDFEGDTGAEQMAVVISKEGEYIVEVRPLGEGSTFVLGSTWLPMDEVALPDDPQGSPAEAVGIELGENLHGEIVNADGDRRDWYRFEAEEDGLLTVATRTREGDLVLEAFAEGEYQNSLAHSDQDIGGDSGRESISLDVEEGDVIFFVISTFGGDAEYALRGVLTDN